MSRRRRRARACARAARCWPTGCYGLCTSRVAKPAARVYVRTRVRKAPCVCTDTDESPFSVAVPISGGTASRCIRETHGPSPPLTVHASVDFQSLWAPLPARPSTFPLFLSLLYSIAFYPFHRLPSTSRLNSFMDGESGLRNGCWSMKD